MNRYSLAEEEIDSIQALLKILRNQYRSAEEQEFLNNASLYAHELPRTLRKCLNDFRLSEPPDGVLMISGYPIDSQRIGRTPSHWNLRPIPAPTIEEEMLIVLLGSLLGEPLGWATQQNGHVVHDVLPIKEHENEQLGTGCLQTLCWHSEDAFHPYRGDYLCMCCLRNPNRVATTYLSIDVLELAEQHKKVLFQPHFTIRPDDSHREKNRSGDSGRTSNGGEALDAAYSRINQMSERPERVAILYGDPSSPYLRIDPYFMDPPDDPEARAAMQALIQAIDSRMDQVALQPGDILFIDNYKVVHGRNPFRAKYDGQDRWLKRINIARDLRKSRAARCSPDSRVIS